MNETAMIRIERRYRACIADIWALWTTPEGIEAWWGPPGFEVAVEEIDLRPGGRFAYVMTASSPRTIAFLQGNGLPLATPSRATFEEVVPMRRLAWRQVVDFIPGHPAYETRLAVDFEEDGKEVTMRVSFEPLHDAEWTARQSAGWEQQLGRLDTLVERGKEETTG